MPPQSASREFHPHRARRDPAEMSRRLARWLSAVPPQGGSAPEVTVSGTGDSEGNGVSSVTVPVHVKWPGPKSGEADYVMRMAPVAADVPVFRTYFLQDQFEVMRLVGELSGVPVPKVRWLEPSGSVLGRPFFLMDAVDGQVPGDMPPYNLGDSWLFDASAADQRRLQEASVAVVADLHRIPDAVGRFGFLLPRFEKETPLRRHLAWAWDWYWFAAGDSGRSPLVERALTWLERHCPRETEDPVLCWGDARIGNILYTDFTPAGVLDWEMASIGPRQLDLAWMISAHGVFEYLAGALGLPGMPSFLRQEDVVASYEERTGRPVGDLSWYLLYAAAQWAIVFLRTGASQVHFGERDRPADTDELIYHRGLLERLVEEAGA